MKKINFILSVYIFFIIGCSSLSEINVCNNTGTSIKIEQYKAPNYYYIEIKNTECKKVYKHANFIIKNNKKYIYNMEKTANKTGSIQINHNMNLYFTADENTQNIIYPLSRLQSFQPTGFPLSPNSEEDILLNSKGLK